MNYTPKHKDVTMRAIYAFLLLFSMVIVNVGTGLVHTILMSIALVMLAVGAFLFIRYDLTSFTYIAIEKEKDFDFFIDKTVGKRNGYVCYYPLSDAISLEKWGRETKKALKARYGKIFFYNYCHNQFKTEKQVLVFKNDNYYDAVIIELGEYQNQLQALIDSAEKVTTDEE
ncbi:MAG: hypothetical protein J6B34_05940 [Clostridia bacterium]|nr:hypothetical protein [Clostridia bacterium]